MNSIDPLLGQRRMTMNLASNHIIKSASEQLAEYLVSDLERGTWVDTLPGTKSLAKHYGVDHKAVAAAMVFLEKWCWIEPAKPRKARVIIPQRTTPKSNIQNLLILHPDESTDTDSAIQFRAQLALLWSAKYRNFAIVSIPRKSPASVAKELSRLVKKHSADALVLNNLSEDWGRAALAVLPTYFSGGTFPKEALENNAISAFCISYSDEITKAYKMLRVLGHRRILFVYKLLDYPLRDLVLALPESSKKEDGLLGLPEEYCIEMNSVKPKDWAEMWKKKVELLKPTAIISLNACAIPSFYSFCNGSGKQIPKDHSILSLEEVKELSYLSPTPLMGKYDYEGHLKHFEKWLEGGLKQTNLVLSNFIWDTQAASIGEASLG